MKLDLFKPAGEKRAPVCIQQFEKGIAITFSKNGQVHSLFLEEAPNNQLVSLQSFIKKNGLKGYPCHYILGNKTYRLMLLDKPNVPDTELSAALPWLVQDLIDDTVEDVALDAFPIPTSQQAVGKIYVVIADKKNLVEISHFIRIAGLSLTKIDIVEFPYLHILNALSESGGCTGLLYLQKNEIHFLFVKSGLIYFTRKVGQTKALEDISNRKALSLELQRSVDYCQVQLRQPPIECIYLTPELKDVITQDEMTVTIRNIPVEKFVRHITDAPCMTTIGEALSHEATN